MSKQTFDDLLHRWIWGLGLPEDKTMTEEEVLAALPGRVTEQTRTFLIQRYGMLGNRSMTYPEIAEGAGLKAGVVESRVKNAIVLLGERLQIGGPPFDANAPVAPKTLLMDLSLTARTYNCLRRDGKLRLEDLEGESEESLLYLSDFGPKSLAEIKAIAKAAGVTIRGGADVKADPNMAFCDILLSDRTGLLLEKISAKTLEDVIPLIQAPFNPENPFWQISAADLGRIFLHLASAGLLA